MEQLHSSPLISNPSFLKGVARSIDLSRTITRYNLSSDQQADREALTRDWKVVGQFIYNAILDYGKSSKGKKSKE